MYVILLLEGEKADIWGPKKIVFSKAGGIEWKILNF
jgi:hypothetical protein